MSCLIKWCNQTIVEDGIQTHVFGCEAESKPAHDHLLKDEAIRSGVARSRGPKSLFVRQLASLQQKMNQLLQLFVSCRRLAKKSIVLLFVFLMNWKGKSRDFLSPLCLCVCECVRVCVCEWVCDCVCLLTQKWETNENLLYPRLSFSHGLDRPVQVVLVGRLGFHYFFLPGKFFPLFLFIPEMWTWLFSYIFKAPV